MFPGRCAPEGVVVTGREGLTLGRLAPFDGGSIGTTGLTGGLGGGGVKFHAGPKKPPGPS